MAVFIRLAQNKDNKNFSINIIKYNAINLQCKILNMKFLPSQKEHIVWATEGRNYKGFGLAAFSLGVAGGQREQEMKGNNVHFSRKLVGQGHEEKDGASWRDSGSEEQ